MSQRKRFIVKTLSVAEAMADLPEMSVFDGASEPIDIYILAAGFEDRVVAIPDLLLKAGSVIRGKILLGEYQTNSEDNLQREAELRPRLLRFGVGDPVAFNADNPESTSSVIRKVLADHGDGVHVAFDISGASSTLILSVIASLLRSERKMKLSIFYAAAKKYNEPSEGVRQEPVIKLGETDFSETGVSEVEINELYPGSHHDHLPVFVIALPSAAPARLRRCLGRLGIEPLSGTEDRVYWILPNTDSADHKWRQTAVKQAVLDVIYGESYAAEIEKSGAKVAQELPKGLFECSDVGNYQACLRSIIERIDANAGSNMFLMHFGTKIQAVGVALAMGARKEVALISARPQAFVANKYSEGIGLAHALVIDDPIAVVQKLSDVGTLSVETK